MVRLGVIDHDHIDLFRRRQAVQAFEVIVGERGLDRIDQSGFLFPLPVGVVGGAAAGGKEFIEELKFGMSSADPVEIGADFFNTGHFFSFRWKWIP